VLVAHFTPEYCLTATTVDTVLFELPERVRSAYEACRSASRSRSRP